MGPYPSTKAGSERLLARLAAGDIPLAVEVAVILRRVALVSVPFLLSCGAAPPPAPPAPTITTSFKNPLGKAVPAEAVTFLDAKPLDQQPRAPGGGYVLAPGSYEMEVETYALSPGKAAGGERTSYLAAELEGPRAKIVAKVLERASWRPDVFQEETQQIIWAIATRAWLNPAHPTISVTLHIVLDDAELNQINANAVLAYRDDTMQRMLKKVPPEAHEALIAQNKMRRLFLAPNASYADMEAVAVPRLGDEGRGAGTWTDTGRGYLIRFLPRNYRQATVQIVVPEPPPVGQEAASPCALANLATMVAAPDAVNRQRLLVAVDREKAVAKLHEATTDNEIKSALTAIAVRCEERAQPKPAPGSTEPVSCRPLDAPKRECVHDFVVEAGNPRVLAGVAWDKKKAPLPRPPLAQGARCGAPPACAGHACADAVVLKSGATSPTTDQIAAAYDFTFPCATVAPIDPKYRKKQVEILGQEPIVISPAPAPAP